MKNRKLFILSIVTLAVILAAGVTSRLRAPQSTFTRQLVFPELTGSINDIAGITIKGNQRTVVLQQQGERWVIASADNYPALFNKIKQNVVGMAELRIVDEKTDKPEFYDRLGVEGPDVEGTKSMLLTLKDRSGQTSGELIIGDKRQSPSNRPGLYVRKPDSAKALLVEGSLDISDQVSAWFENHLFDIPTSRVQEVRISYPGAGAQPQEDLVIRKDTREQPDFSINISSLGKEPGASIIANRISRGLEEMRAENVQSLQNFNFPDDNTFTTTVSTFDGLVVTARLTQNDNVHYANFTFTDNPPTSIEKPESAGVAGATASPVDTGPAATNSHPAAGAEMFNKTLSAWVFEIPDFLYEALTTRPDQFRKLNLLPTE